MHARPYTAAEQLGAVFFTCNAIVVDCTIVQQVSQRERCSTETGREKGLRSLQLMGEQEGRVSPPGFIIT